MAQNVARQKEVTTREVASIRFGMYMDEEVRSVCCCALSLGWSRIMPACIEQRMAVIMPYNTASSSKQLGTATEVHT